MNISSVITTQAKTLDRIDKNISALLSMQKQEEKRESLRERRATQAAKRAEADRKKQERISAIGGGGGEDKKNNKIDSKKLFTALGLAAAGTAIVAYFKSEKFRNFVNEKIFAPIGDFFKTKLGELGELIKQFALDLPEKLFGDKGLFGKENREKFMEAMFGKKGLFGPENRKAVGDALFGDKGIFSKKNVS